jgi:hypothetical protein
MHALAGSIVHMNALVGTIIRREVACACIHRMVDGYEIKPFLAV